MDNNDEDEYLYGSEPSAKKQKTEELSSMYDSHELVFGKLLTTTIKILIPQT